MLIEFWKMNGAGNDFVAIDNRDDRYALTQEQIATLCHRQRGVGGDGLLAVEPSQNRGSDFRMRYYNSDGREAEMCGNGARCFARFVQKLDGSFTEHLSFETPAGVIRAHYLQDHVCLDMSDPVDLSLHHTLSIHGGEVVVHTVNTGVPHAVILVDSIEQVDVLSLGAAIRNHAHFLPKGTNVNFVETAGERSLSVRTYERGVENETLACGTGIVASALIYHQLTEKKVPFLLSLEEEIHCKWILITMENRTQKSP